MFEAPPTPIDDQVGENQMSVVQLIRKQYSFNKKMD